MDDLMSLKEIDRLAIDGFNFYKIAEQLQSLFKAARAAHQYKAENEKLRKESFDLAVELCAKDDLIRNNKTLWGSLVSTQATLNKLLEAQTVNMFLQRQLKDENERLRVGGKPKAWLYWQYDDNPELDEPGCQIAEPSCAQKQPLYARSHLLPTVEEIAIGLLRSIDGYPGRAWLELPPLGKQFYMNLAKDIYALLEGKK